MSERYISLFPRIKAATIDGILLILMMYLSSELLAEFDNVPNYVRTVLFVCIFCLYEPLMVSLWGKTLGQHKMDICVRRANNLDKKLLLHKAILRYAIKFALGWLSLVSITGSAKHQALHDKAVNSVVVQDNQ